MKIPIRLENGEIVEVQFCRNKYGTVFVRTLPSTVKNPTEKQKEVRFRFGKASFEAFGKSREEVIENIRKEFSDWIKEPKKRNEIEEKIKDEYPEDYRVLVEFLKSFL